MGRCSSRSCKLTTMLGLTATFFLVEIIVGYVTNSVALVADSFHMLSDVVALIVGFASVKISKWPSKRNTYGWVRAEILGALVNAVFLLALCFSILVEALKRLVEVEKVDNVLLLLVVGGAGLLINLIGLCLFGGHGHSHGGSGDSGHGHSHVGNSHGHSHTPCDDSSKDVLIERASLTLDTQDSKLSHEVDSQLVYKVPKEEITEESIVIELDKPKKNHASQLNMRGVFLHVLGDALGSVVVIVSALVIWFVEGDWKYYVDPAMSIIMVFIILCTTIPLLKESAFILLQTVPSHVNVDNIIDELEKMDGIVGVHEVHIWQLAGNRIVASAHIRCRNIGEYMELAGKIKALFHKEGIHSTTIQPEFIEHDRLESDSCLLLCHTIGDPCKKNTCCGDRSHPMAKRDNTITSVINLNQNNSNLRGTRSVDLKFSPDGDEIVLEMTDIANNVDSLSSNHTV